MPPAEKKRLDLRQFDGQAANACLVTITRGHQNPRPVRALEVTAVAVIIIAVPAPFTLSGNGSPRPRPDDRADCRTATSAERATEEGPNASPEYGATKCILSRRLMNRHHQSQTQHRRDSQISKHSVILHSVESPILVQLTVRLVFPRLPGWMRLCIRRGPRHIGMRLPMRNGAAPHHSRASRRHPAHLHRGSIRAERRCIRVERSPHHSDGTALHSHGRAFGSDRSARHSPA